MNIADYIRRKKLSQDGDSNRKPKKAANQSKVDVTSSCVSISEDLAVGNLSSLADWRALQIDDQTMTNLSQIDLSNTLHRIQMARLKNHLR